MTLTTRIEKTSVRYFWKAGSASLILAGIICLVNCQGVSTSGSGQSGALSLASLSLDFGSVTAGTSKTLTVNATNTGTSSVTISNASCSTQYFSLVSPSLPITVAAGQTTAVSVKFSPNAVGAFSANATITSDASNSALTVPLSGTGIAASAGQLTVNPTSLALGNVVVGTSGTASGSLIASGASVTVTAATADNSAFSVGGLSLPTTIPAGQSASFNVTFSPLTSAAASATLTFTSNAQTSTTTETLTGTGTPAPTHTVNLSWNASTSSNISGYNVYRAVFGTSCGSYAKINSVLTTGTLYTDSVVVDGTN